MNDRDNDTTSTWNGSSRIDLPDMSSIFHTRSESTPPQAFSGGYRQDRDGSWGNAVSLDAPNDNYIYAETHDDDDENDDDLSDMETDEGISSIDDDVDGDNNGIYDTTHHTMYHDDSYRLGNSVTPGHDDDHGDSDIYGYRRETQPFADDSHAHDVYRDDSRAYVAPFDGAYDRYDTTEPPAVHDSSLPQHYNNGGDTDNRDETIPYSDDTDHHNNSGDIAGDESSFDPDTWADEEPSTIPENFPVTMTTSADVDEALKNHHVGGSALSARSDDVFSHNVSSFDAMSPSIDDDSLPTDTASHATSYSDYDNDSSESDAIIEPDSGDIPLSVDRSYSYSHDHDSVHHDSHIKYGDSNGHTGYSPSSPYGKELAPESPHRHGRDENVHDHNAHVSRRDDSGNIAPATIEISEEKTSSRHSHDDPHSTSHTTTTADDPRHDTTPLQSPSTFDADSWNLKGAGGREKDTTLAGRDLPRGVPALNLPVYTRRILPSSVGEPDEDFDQYHLSRTVEYDVPADGVLNPPHPTRRTVPSDDDHDALDELTHHGYAETTRQENQSPSERLAQKMTPTQIRFLADSGMGVNGLLHRSDTLDALRPPAFGTESRAERTHREYAVRAFLHGNNVFKRGGGKRFSQQQRDVVKFLAQFKWATTRHLTHLGTYKKGACEHRLRAMYDMGVVETFRIPGVDDRCWNLSRVGMMLSPVTSKKFTIDVMKPNLIIHHCVVNYVAAQLWGAGVNVLHEKEFPRKNRVGYTGRTLYGDILISEPQMQSSLRTICQQAPKEVFKPRIMSQITEEFDTWNDQGGIEFSDSPEFMTGNEYMWVLFPVSVVDKAYHVPDLVVARRRSDDGQAQSIAIEVEMANKPEDAYERTLRAYRDDDGHIYKRVVWICSKRATASKLKRIAAGLHMSDRVSTLPILLSGNRPATPSTPVWNL